MTSSPVSPPPTDGAGPEAGRARGGGARAWIVGFVVSALLHGAAILLYPVLMARITPEPARPAAPGPRARPQGMEVLQLAEIPAPSADPVDRPEEPREEPEPQPEPTRIAPEPAEPAADAPADPRSAAERLRAPTEGDPRLWRPVDPELTELTDEERARLRFYARLEALNDSALSEEERARLAREWVYTDDDGRRWGVSPGQLHLGDVTIPLPFGFAAPPSATDAAADWRWRDAERGSGTSIIRDTWKERAEAIRERRDAERAQEADTSGVRR